MKGKSWLTVKEKILLHLAYFSEHHNDHRVPREVSQKGIAEAVGISQKHLSQYIRPMIKADLVLERSSYILEGRQRQKVYFLTELGRREAEWMRDGASRKRSHSVSKRVGFKLPQLMIDLLVVSSKIMHWFPSRAFFGISLGY